MQDETEAIAEYEAQIAKFASDIERMAPNMKALER